MNRKNTVDYQELLKRYYEGKTTLGRERTCSGPTSFLIRKRTMPTLPFSVSWLKKVKPSHLTEWNNVWKLG